MGNIYTTPLEDNTRSVLAGHNPEIDQSSRETLETHCPSESNLRETILNRPTADGETGTQLDAAGRLYRTEGRNGITGATSWSLNAVESPSSNADDSGLGTMAGRHSHQLFESCDSGSTPYRRWNMEETETLDWQRILSPTTPPARAAPFETPLDKETYWKTQPRTPPPMAAPLEMDVDMEDSQFWTPPNRRRTVATIVTPTESEAERSDAENGAERRRLQRTEARNWKEPTGHDADGVEDRHCRAATPCSATPNPAPKTGQNGVGD